MMFASRGPGFVLSLILVLTALSTTTHAQSDDVSSDGDPGNLTAQYRLFGWHNCGSKGQDKKAILDAFSEAHKILGAYGNYYIDEGGSLGENCWHSMNAVEFFGNPSAVKLGHRRKSIRQNFRKAYDFTNGWKFNSHNTQIFCHDESMFGIWKDACSAEDQPSPIVVVPNYRASGQVAMML